MIQVTGHVPGPAGQPHGPVFAIDQPDPDHAEIPGLDGQVADVLEKPPAILGADDGLVDLAAQGVHAVGAQELGLGPLAFADVANALEIVLAFDGDHSGAGFDREGQAVLAPVHGLEEQTVPFAAFF